VRIPLANLLTNTKDATFYILYLVYYLIYIYLSTIL